MDKSIHMHLSFNVTGTFRAQLKLLMTKNDQNDTNIAQNSGNFKIS